MSFALSSIVRTRQKKTFFSLFILTLFLFHPSGVQASEEENIDSFDVHPTNRWEIVVDDSDITSVAITDGKLNFTEIGDGTQDFYWLLRDLRDKDGKVELSFKVNSNGTGNAFQNGLEIRLNDDSDSADMFELNINRIRSTITTTTLVYKDGSTSYSKQLSGSEVVRPNVWYNLRFDYDLLRSDLRARLYFSDNNSKVFDYNWQDIDNTAFPTLFNQDKLAIEFVMSGFTTNQITEILVDYVSAPFKEREWTNSDVPVGYLANNWFGCSTQDDIDDVSTWDLTVPYFDSVSGTIIGDCADSTVLAAGEVMVAYFVIYAVDYDDGDLHNAVSIQLRMEEQIAPLLGFGAHCRVYIDGILLMSLLAGIDDGDVPTIKFSFGTSEDRSRIGGSVVFHPDPDNDVIYTQSFSVAMSAVTTEASQEFILQTNYQFDFDGNTEFYGYINDIKIYERDFLADRVIEWITPYIPGIIEDVKSGDDIFVLLFRWLGQMIADAFEFVISILTSAIELALGLVETAIGALEPFLTLIQESIDALVGYIQAIAGEIITALGNAAQTLLVAFFDALVFLIDALADVVFAFWNAITGDWDLLALVNELLAYIIELIDWTLATFLDIVQLADDLSWIILSVWWIWALPVQWARAGGNPLAGLGNFIEVYFYDAMPWSIFGVHLYIPQGIIFTLWMILLLPADFVLFTALGL